MKNLKGFFTLAILSLILEIPYTGLGKTLSTIPIKYELKGSSAPMLQNPFSPDGSKVLTKRTGIRSGPDELYISSTRDGNLLETLQHDASISQAEWSPDSQSIIVYTRKTPGTGSDRVFLWDISYLNE
jgi:dipeptidyl aminopeptidase/acylaminoacyl peptidase